MAMTPGPWEWKEGAAGDGGGVLLIDANHYPVVEDSEGYGGLVVKDDDARLIAAAPELRDLLEWALGVIDQAGEHALAEAGTYGRARALLVRIKGGG